MNLRIWTSCRTTATRAPDRGGDWGREGGPGQLGGAGIELLVNWAGLTALDGSPVSGTQVALAQVLVTALSKYIHGNAA